MIIAERKPINEIKDMVKDYQNISIIGCETCVAICMAGGLKEAGIVASALRLAFQNEGQKKSIEETSVERQCEWEFIETVKDKVENSEVVVSLACGIGVQTLAERYKNKVIYPGVNTTFLGLPLEQGVWAERCAACGKCILDLTGGVCPIARCSKSLLNGPCGGSQNGKCEINKEVDCGWQLIYDRLTTLNQLDKLDEIMEPKDWSTSRDGGPRKIIREDMKI